jgi:hypothetical protein
VFTTVKLTTIASMTALLATACLEQAPRWNKFRIAPGPSTTVIAGRFHASFKDGRRARKCSVNISDVVVHFDEWGLVFMNVPPGRVRLKSLSCLDGSTIYEWGLEPYVFDAERGVVTYFGDVIVQWQTKGGYKIGQAFGLVGALATDPRADPATDRLQSKPAEVQEAFEKQTGRKLKWRTELAALPGEPFSSQNSTSRPEFAVSNQAGILAR